MLRVARSRMGLAKTQAIMSVASALSEITHFSQEECKSLLILYENLNINASGRVDRLRFREFLTCCFDITDDVMLDLTFRAFDRNSDGLVDEIEFIKGLSVSLRGDLEQLIEFCYFAYDMNGDRSLAREELYQCLKGCMIPGYGVDTDELEDAEKDIVEIAMRKLDTNRDGQITYDDFQMAVRQDPLLLQSCGECLPNPKSMATFLATMSGDYRAYTFQGQGYVPSRGYAKHLHGPMSKIRGYRPSTARF